MSLCSRAASGLALLLGLASGCTGASDDPRPFRPPLPTTLEPEPTASSSAASSSASTGVSAAPAPLGELDIDPRSFDFAGNKELTGRIAETPHQYFRFVNKRFMAAVCARLERLEAKFPSVRLHGDPHVEQYAVTDLGRGLTDFDDAAVGPSAVDLVRFGTSLVLAARIRGFSDAEVEKLFAELFRGYRDGLAGKPLPAEPPAFAGLLATKFKKDRAGFLGSIDQTILPLEEGDEPFLKEQLAAYQAAAREAKEPKRAAGFYAVKKSGRLKVGVGSALARKYLLRLEGPSAEADDDVVLELKEVSDLSAATCVTAQAGAAAAGRRAEQDRAKASTLLVPLLLPGGKFWVNEWLANFQEVKIKKLEREADLEALAYEAGWDLTREHLGASAAERPATKGKPDKGKPDKEAEAKRRQLELDAAHEAAVRRMSVELADASKAGWERFLREVAAKKTGSATP